jgi:hypothetical protein
LGNQKAKSKRQKSKVERPAASGEAISHLPFDICLVTFDFHC